MKRPHLLPLATIGLLLGLSGCNSSRIVAWKLIQAPGDRYIKESEELREVQPFLDFVANGGIDERTGEETFSPFRYESITLPRSGIQIQVAAIDPMPLELEMISSCQVRIGLAADAGKSVHIESNFHLDLTSLTEPPLPRAASTTILLLHGYGANKETLLPWALFLANKGYQAILVDLRGHGKSGGERVYFGTRETGDLMELLDELPKQMKLGDHIGVFGHSYGAGIGIRWAARDSRIQSVVALSPYSSPREAIPQVAKLYGVSIKPRVLERSLQWLEKTGQVDWKLCEIYEDLQALPYPILLVSGEWDVIATADMMTELLELALEGTLAVEVPMAQHHNIINFYSDLTGPIERYFSESGASIEPNLSYRPIPADPLQSL